jgi:hypothetical protein
MPLSVWGTHYKQCSPVFEQVKVVVTVEADALLSDVVVRDGDLPDDALIPVPLPIVGELASTNCKNLTIRRW